MSKNKSQPTFVESMRNAIGNETAEFPTYKFNGVEGWAELASKTSEIASTLFPNDERSRSEFLGAVLGFELSVVDASE